MSQDDLLIVARQLRGRDIANLPTYESDQVAHCLKPSPIGIANGTRPAPAKRATSDPFEGQAFRLWQEQLRLYSHHQAGSMHQYEYDPCRSW